jgi:hypothetical protein
MFLALSVLLCHLIIFADTMLYRSKDIDNINITRKKIDRHIAGSRVTSIVIKELTHRNTIVSPQAIIVS